MDHDNGLACCRAVDNEIKKVNQKMNDAGTEITNIDQAIVFLEDIQRRRNTEDTDDSEEQRMLLHQAVLQTNSACSKFSKGHKEIHSSISKFGKSIDKNFTSDYATILNARDTEMEHQINQCITQHFLREGEKDVAESIMQEADLELDEDLKAPFLELNQIVSALQQRDLNPAFRWASENSEALHARGSPIELRLQRLRYIQLLGAGPSHQHEALAYIRSVAAGHSVATAPHLQVLMAALMYVGRLHESPYSMLLAPVEWDDTREMFVKDYCALLALPQHSPLAVSVRVGCLAVSPLLSIRHVLKQSECHAVWRSEDELPIEINTGPGAQFHSMFACPILRQRSSHNNPPMRLSCGHVISRDAVHRLSSMNRIKCPYCPQEMTVADCRQLHF